MVLTAIAARGDRSLLPTAIEASGSETDAIRKAGIQALGKLGDVSVIPLLLGHLAKKSAMSAVAADSLAQKVFQGPDCRALVAGDFDITILDGKVARRRTCRAPGLDRLAVSFAD